MDSDFWTSRLAAAKRRFNLQHHQHQLQHHHGLQLDRLNIDDLEVEVEDEIRPDFPCPFCYEDFDLTSLCSHLEDEHSSESKFAICPICSVKVTRDMLSHITLQHGHLLKLQRRRRLRRVGAVPSSQSLSLLGRDLREAHIQVLQRGSGSNRTTYRSTTDNASNNSISDSLVSSLVFNFPSMEIDEFSKSLASTIDEPSSSSSSSSSMNCSASQRMWKSSFDPSLSSEEREKRIEQAKIRSVFVQDLFASALSIS